MFLKKNSKYIKTGLVFLPPAEKLCSNPPAAAIPKMYTLNNIAYISFPFDYCVHIQSRAPGGV